MKAMASMAGNQRRRIDINIALAPPEGSDADLILAAAHRAVGSTMLPWADDQGTKYVYYPMLTTENLTGATYKPSARV